MKDLKNMILENHYWRINDNNGVNHKFQYWRKSKTFSIVFCPQKRDIIVRIICFARTK